MYHILLLLLPFVKHFHSRTISPFLFPIKNNYPVSPVKTDHYSAVSSVSKIITDLWGFLKFRKKFWLLPIIATLFLFGALIVMTSGSAIAPFIYTLF